MDDHLRAYQATLPAEWSDYLRQRQEIAHVDRLWSNIYNYTTSAKARRRILVPDRWSPNTIPDGL